MKIITDCVDGGFSWYLLYNGQILESGFSMNPKEAKTQAEDAAYTKWFSGLDVEDN